MKSNVVIVIPARWGATRFPGKSLALLQRKPLVQWVWEAARKSKVASRVVVATDDRRIAEAVTGFGGEFVMTKKSHASGTDRMAEVAAKVPGKIFINAQGDEPLLQAAVIDELVKKLGTAPMGTLVHELTDNRDFQDPNCVKVVCDAKMNALYFSRAPIPFVKGDDHPPSQGFGATGRMPRPVKVWRHIGIYAFQREALRQFVGWKRGVLERAESLEQLRALENGMKVRVVPVKLNCVGVDTPSDLIRVESLLAGKP
jgi:3-deoxy-manno-octulosonate cytidylyltransferase (CMP-KDO synthetase)